MLSWESLKKFFGNKAGSKKNYGEIAQKVAGEAGLVKDFVEKHKDCSIRTALAGDREYVEYLGERHKELSGYASHPDRLFCVSFDSLPKGMMGIPERPQLRVYVDVRKEKIVAMDASNYRQVLG